MLRMSTSSSKGFGSGATGVRWYAPAEMKVSDYLAERDRITENEIVFSESDFGCTKGVPAGFVTPLVAQVWWYPGGTDYSRPVEDRIRVTLLMKELRELLESNPEITIGEAEASVAGVT